MVVVLRTVNTHQTDFFLTGGGLGPPETGRAGIRAHLKHNDTADPQKDHQTNETDGDLATGVFAVREGL